MRRTFIFPCSASDFSASFRHQVYVEFASGNVINVAWQQKMNGKIQLMEFKENHLCIANVPTSDVSRLDRRVRFELNPALY